MSDQNLTEDFHASFRFTGTHPDFTSQNYEENSQKYRING